MANPIEGRSFEEARPGDYFAALLQVGGDLVMVLGQIGNNQSDCLTPVSDKVCDSLDLRSLRRSNGVITPQVWFRYHCQLYATCQRFAAFDKAEAAAAWQSFHAGADHDSHGLLASLSQVLPQVDNPFALFGQKAEIDLGLDAVKTSFTIVGLTVRPPYGGDYAVRLIVQGDICGEIVKAIVPSVRQAVTRSFRLEMENPQSRFNGAVHGTWRLI